MRWSPHYSFTSSVFCLEWLSDHVNRYLCTLSQNWFCKNLHILDWRFYPCKKSRLWISGLHLGVFSNFRISKANLSCHESDRSKMQNVFYCNVSLRLTLTLLTWAHFFPGQVMLRGHWPALIEPTLNHCTQPLYCWKTLPLNWYIVVYFNYLINCELFTKLAIHIYTSYKHHISL